MMADDFEACLAFTLAREGGFSQDPRDSGGATQCGITLATYRGWLDEPDATVAALRAMTRDQVGAIYRVGFWQPMRCQDLPRGVGLMAFDHGVTAGVRRSAMLLQAAAGVEADGWIGPATLAAVRSAGVTGLIDRLGRAQDAYYRGCRQFPAFGKGWLARLAMRKLAAGVAARADEAVIYA